MGGPRTHCLTARHPTCRDAGSTEMSLDTLTITHTAFVKAAEFSANGQQLYAPLRDATGAVISWMDRLVSSGQLKRTDTGRDEYEEQWMGDKVSCHRRGCTYTKHARCGWLTFYVAKQQAQLLNCARHIQSWRSKWAMACD